MIICYRPYSNNNGFEAVHPQKKTWGRLSLMPNSYSIHDSLRRGEHERAGSTVTSVVKFCQKFYRLFIEFHGGDVSGTIKKVLRNPLKEDTVTKM